MSKLTKKICGLENVPRILGTDVSQSAHLLHVTHECIIISTRTHNIAMRDAAAERMLLLLGTRHTAGAGAQFKYDYYYLNARIVCVMSPQPFCLVRCACACVAFWLLLMLCCSCCYASMPLCRGQLWRVRLRFAQRSIMQRMSAYPWGHVRL